MILKNKILITLLLTGLIIGFTTVTAHEDTQHNEDQDRGDMPENQMGSMHGMDHSNSNMMIGGIHDNSESHPCHNH